MLPFLLSVLDSLRGSIGMELMGLNIHTSNFDELCSSASSMQSVLTTLQAHKQEWYPTFVLFLGPSLPLF